jgi:hypothetical protein
MKNSNHIAAAALAAIVAFAPDVPAQDASEEARNNSDSAVMQAIDQARNSIRGAQLLGDSMQSLRFRAAQEAQMSSGLDLNAAVNIARIRINQAARRAAEGSSISPIQNLVHDAAERAEADMWLDALRDRYLPVAISERIGLTDSFGRPIDEQANYVEACSGVITELPNPDGTDDTFFVSARHCFSEDLSFKGDMHVETRMPLNYVGRHTDRFANEWLMDYYHFVNAESGYDMAYTNLGDREYFQSNGCVRLPVEGEEIVSIGFSGSTPAVMRGTVGERAGDYPTEARFISDSADLTYGDSGAPVFGTSDQCLVGVYVRGVTTPNIQYFSTISPRILNRSDYNQKSTRVNPKKGKMRHNFKERQK